MGHRNLDVVEGWTARLDFQLLSCALPFALTTADTIAPLVTDRDGTVIATASGQVTVITGSSGEVGWNPATTNTLQSSAEPYYVRFEVKDNLGKYAYFPMAEPFTIGVRSA